MVVTKVHRKASVVCITILVGCLLVFDFALTGEGGVFASTRGWAEFSKLQQKPRPQRKSDWKICTDPYWTFNTAQENQTYENVFECMRRLFPQIAGSRLNSTSPRMTLRCPDDELEVEENTQISSFNRSIIENKYEQIWFIGDSIVRQQFFNFICMIDHRISKSKVESFTSRGFPKTPKVNPLNADFIWYYHYNTNNTNTTTTMLQNGVGNNSIPHRTIKFRYSKFAKKSPVGEKGLYEYAFQDALREAALNLQQQNFTGKNGFSSFDDSNVIPKHLILVGAGAHYEHYEVDRMARAIQYISQQIDQNSSYYSSLKDSIMFLESPDMQWPTSNGLWTKACSGKCHCEALTPERVLGIGNVEDKSELNISIVSMDQNRLPSPEVLQHRILMDLYSNIFENKNGTSQAVAPTEYSIRQQHNPCIPSCLPANWRNKVAQNVLNGSEVMIVPLWKQLVAHRALHSLGKTDCTHKSSTALIAMNHQLLRTMKKQQEYVAAMKYWIRTERGALKA